MNDKKLQRIRDRAAKKRENDAKKAVKSTARDAKKAARSSTSATVVRARPRSGGPKNTARAEEKRGALARPNRAAVSRPKRPQAVARPTLQQAVLQMDAPVLQVRKAADDPRAREEEKRRDVDDRESAKAEEEAKKLSLQGVGRALGGLLGDTQLQLGVDDDGRLQVGVGSGAEDDDDNDTYEAPDDDQDEDEEEDGELSFFEDPDNLPYIVGAALTGLTLLGGAAAVALS